MYEIENREILQKSENSIVRKFEKKFPLSHFCLGSTKKICSLFIWYLSPKLQTFFEIFGLAIGRRIIIVSNVLAKNNLISSLSIFCRNFQSDICDYADFLQKSWFWINFSEKSDTDYWYSTLTISHAFILNIKTTSNSQIDFFLTRHFSHFSMRHPENLTP